VGERDGVRGHVGSWEGAFDKIGLLSPALSSSAEEREKTSPGQVEAVSIYACPELSGENDL